MPSSPASSQNISSDPSGNDTMRIRARGRSFLALILSPEAPLELWLKGLDEQTNRSAGFFNGRPIILDLSLLEKETDGLENLQQALKSRGLYIISIEGATPDWPALHHWDWPNGPTGGRLSGPINIPDTTQLPENTNTPTTLESTTLIIERAVRSGQSIQNPDGDIVILGAVSSGAEIIAGGSIHVYGPLRGRAIAGLDDHSDARIYTMHLEAELLALNGFYMVTDEISPDLLGKPAQALLEDKTLTIRPLIKKRN